MTEYVSVLYYPLKGKTRYNFVKALLEYTPGKGYVASANPIRRELKENRYAIENVDIDFNYMRACPRLLISQVSRKTKKNEEEAKFMFVSYANEMAQNVADYFGMSIAGPSVSVQGADKIIRGQN